MACDGQRAALGQLLAVRTLTLLGASCGGHLDDEILLEGDGPTETAIAPFGFPDFLARAGATGEECEVATSVLREHGRDIQGYGPRMWRVRVHFDSPVLCSALRLPLNPGIHLFDARIAVADGAVPEQA
ncbi:hypothetical protein ACFU96_40580 [Streptomyces sp. NPDC057620]|uniref:hypothetical protein n=1 Tax=Streptomyces sp. NPDC057620 TaxID=3346185 RepID=UPI0036CE4243